MKRSKSKRAPPPIVEEDAVSDAASDLSLMSDGEDEEAAGSGASAQAFGQPTTWAQVDVTELQLVAAAIAQNAMPDAERADVGPRLPPAALDVDDRDPLGFGRLDLATLALTREEVGQAPKARPSRLSLPTGSLLSKQTDVGAGGDAQPSRRSHALPSSEHFDPKLYLGIVHGETPMQDLLRGLEHLQAQLSEHTGQLKRLVKENFTRFISSKDTIDDVAAKLRAAEAEGGVGVNGATPGEVAAAVMRAQENARRAFGPLLERQARAERLKAVLGVLDQHDSLVGLPSRVQRHAQAGNYAGLLEEYRRARCVLENRGSGAFQADQNGAGQSSSVGTRLMGEVDKVVASVVHTLETTVRSAYAPCSEVFDAMKHLALLRAAGAPPAAGLDPLLVYLEAQESHIKAVLEAEQQQYKVLAAAAERQQRQGLAAEGVQGPPLASNLADLASVEYVAAITGAVVCWLPPFWELTHQKAPELVAAGLSAEVVEVSTAACQRCLSAVLEQYACAVQSVLPSCSPQGSSASTGRGASLGHEAVAAVVAELTAGYAQLHTQPAPAEASATLRVLVEQAGRAAIEQVHAHMTTAGAAVCAADGREVTAGTVYGRRQAVPHALREVATTGLHFLIDLQAACSTAKVDVTGAGTPHRPHELLCSALTAYVEAATTSASSPADTIAAGPERHLLELSSNLAMARMQILPQLAAAWAPLLAAGASPQEVDNALRTCAASIESAEVNLVGLYIGRKQTILDTLMEEFFFGSLPFAQGPPLRSAPTEAAASTEWDLAPPPHCIRPIALDLLAALAAMQAELATTAPAVLRDVMCELLAGLLEGVGEVVRDGLPRRATPGGLCQVWLEVAVLQAAVQGLLASDSGVESAFTQAGSVLAEQLEAALGAAPVHELAAVAAWCAGTSAPDTHTAGNAPGVETCRQRLQELTAAEMQAKEAVVRPLRLLSSQTVQFTE